MNEESLERLPGELRVSHIHWNLGGEGQRKIPSKFESELRLKVGARVMFTQNKYDENKKILWTNGSTGTVLEFSPPQGQNFEEVKVRLDNGRIVRVGREIFEEHRSVRVTLPDGKTKIKKELVAEAIQFPLTLGWAFTIHKSQGKTIPKVRVNVSDGFTPGMAYTALSRTRNIDDISISGAVGPRHFPPVDARLSKYLVSNFTCFEGLRQNDPIGPMDPPTDLDFIE
jgi:hypothetical protein